MKRLLITATALLVSLATLAQAEKIELKKSFFSGWKYSVGGFEYKKVGMSGKSLRSVMEGNEDAQIEMDKYASSKTLAAVTGFPGGFLIGWPLGGYLASSEWKDSYTTMYIIGVPLTVISIVFEVNATKHLKKGVRLYNGEEQALNLDIRMRRPFASTENGTLMFGVVWSF